MPKVLLGKKLTPHEHRMWRKTFASAKRSGATSPGAVATAAVKKARRKAGKKVQRKGGRKGSRGRRRR